jgi:hypothetical protein
LGKVVLVVLYTLLVFGIVRITCGCVTVPAKPAEVAVTGGTKDLVEGCTKCGQDYWKCRNEALSNTYITIVGLEKAIKKCRHDLDSAVKVYKLKLEERNWQIQERDVKLGKWWRKWYIVGPIGVAAGILAGLLLGG